jgi:hypothetical protein
MTLARQLLPKDISRKAMAPFIPEAHKEENLCTINRLYLQWLFLRALGRTRKS